MSVKVSTAYEHEPSNTAPIYLAVSKLNIEPAEEDFQPAYRDTEDGQLVIWARFDAAPTAPGALWVKDEAGIRKAEPV